MTVTRVPMPTHAIPTWARNRKSHLTSPYRGRREASESSPSWYRAVLASRPLKRHLSRRQVSARASSDSTNDLYLEPVFSGIHHRSRNRLAEILADSFRSDQRNRYRLPAGTIVFNQQ